MNTRSIPYTSTRTIRRMSLMRLLLTFVLLGGFGYLTMQAFVEWQGVSSVAGFNPWFAAYVDVTLTPTYDFEQRASDSASDAVLSFIVSDPNDVCQPTWGGRYTLDEAADALDLDRRIARFQQQGGKIAVSFGGALNSEMALKCTDQAKLLSAYQTVIERYKINTIDLDLENESLSDADALQRRAQVMAALQNEYKKEGKVIAVWLTLPVAPQGLSQAGTDAVSVMLKNGVDLSGVNVMVMDYGEAKDKNDTMFMASQKALNETHRQLGILYQQADIDLNSYSLWRKIGATPMIGQNDIQGEIFTIKDAQSLDQFARQNGIGRMSMWSANRDIPCGENYVNVSVQSNFCSGVSAAQYAFAHTLANGFDGDLMQNAKMITTSDATSTPMVDDPSTSPYQIWQQNGIYVKGVKVVWHGNVYEAKWWTKNDLPDNPVLQEWETPWQLIGPVLPGDKPVQLLTLPTGTYPAWSGYTVYNAGDRVLFENKPYYAKWWTQGQSPAASASNPDNSPWVPLSQDEIELIRKAQGLDQ